MPRKKADPTVEPEPTVEQRATVAANVAGYNPSAELVAALVQAINSTKPVEKKTSVNRKPRTPWTPKDGSPKVKFKREMYQHGLKIDPDMVTNEEAALLNKLRPGRFLDGFVTVYRRRDKGIDIDYPIKTAAQRLRLVNQFGIRNLKELLERCIEEANNPTKFETNEDADFS